MEQWNRLAVKYGRHQVTSIRGARAEKLTHRLAEFQDFWERTSKALWEAGEFLRSKTWFTFDWLITSHSNATKFFDGAYSAQNSSTPARDPKAGSGVAWCDKVIEQEERKKNGTGGLLEDHAMGSAFFSTGNPA